jgi:hypothetical protein
MDENTAAAQNDPRKERLAKALRDNLKRRKAQARALSRQHADASEPQERAGQASERKS